jgi:nucleoside-triphosphatase
MKILLTGLPKAGKSTILEKFKKNYKGNIAGVISHAIKAEDGSRVGFEAESMQGERRIFAHKTQIKSDNIMGGKYALNVDGINNFIVPEMKKGLEDNNILVLLDEIGRIQSFSDLFLQTTRDLLNSQAPLLGTIVYDPEPWSLEFKEHPDVVLITVSEENRDTLTEQLLLIFSHLSSYNTLNDKQKDAVRKMLQKYFDDNASIQIGKLFNNAIPYVLNDQVKKNEGNTYRVKGHTRDHKIAGSNGMYLCDCDLFNGKGEYINQQGECSHIQAIELLHHV